MSDPFVGEIRMFAGNYAPRGWARCDGQLLSVASYSALFSLLGTTYGGDGRTTFGLPDLRGRLPVHYGSGPGLTPRQLGSRGGQETVVLNAANLPSHSHTFRGTRAVADSGYPADRTVAWTDVDEAYFGDHAPVTTPPGTALDSRAVSNTGGSRAHNNLMPYQCVTFIIALVGTYPSRN